jgi:hypothetical protein
MLNQFQDVFKYFQKNEVRYLVIGGIASVLYGVPRATFDLDILIDPTIENAQNLLNALSEAGLGTASLTSAETLLSHEITIFRDRIRIDVQTSTPGIEFLEAWENREILQYQNQHIYLLSKNDLIASKLASGREIDLEDVRILTLGVS